MSRHAVPLVGLLILLLACLPSGAMAQRWEANSANTAVVKVACNASVFIFAYDLRPPRARTEVSPLMRSDGSEVKRYRQFMGEYRFDITKGRCRTRPNVGQYSRECAATFREYGLRTFFVRPGRRRTNPGAITFDRHASHCWLRMRVQAVARSWSSTTRPRNVWRSTGSSATTGSSTFGVDNMGATSRVGATMRNLSC